jgi:hypothetical protein
VDQSQSFDEIGSSREGEGTVVYIEKLENFICHEFARVVCLWGVSSQVSNSKFFMAHGPL